MALRVCVAKFSLLIDVVDGRLTGAFAPVFNAIYVDANRYISNFTYVTAGKSGKMDPLTGRYDGCLGILQDNGSDIAIPTVTFPVLGQGLAQGYTSASSKIMMVSTYNSATSQSHSDVMDAFRSLSSGTWSLTLLLSLAISMIIFQVYRRDMGFTESLIQLSKVLIGNMVKQHSSYPSRWRRPMEIILLIMFAVSSCLILFCISSMIKTEMVVQKRPSTISSYEELLQQKQVKPIWARSLNDHLLFKKAERGSVQSSIWDRAMTFGIGKCFVDASTISQVITDVIQRKSVWLAPSYLMSSFVTNICSYIRTAGVASNMNAWVRSDESDPERLSGTMTSNSSTPLVRKKIYAFQQAVAETGIKAQAYRRMDYVVGPDTGAKGLRDCVANVLIYPDREIFQLDLSLYGNLIIIVSSLLLVSVVTFSMECLFPPLLKPEPIVIHTPSIARHRMPHCDASSLGQEERDR